MNKKPHDPDKISFQVAAWLTRLTARVLRKEILNGRLDPTWRDGKMTFTSTDLIVYLSKDHTSSIITFAESATFKEFKRRLDLWLKQSPTG